MNTKSNEKQLNIFEFINKNNYQIQLGDWFKNIWFPLFEEKDILITNNILKFIHFGTNNSATDGHPSLRRIKEDLKKTLENYNLDYKIITYEDVQKDYKIITYEDVQKDYKYYNNLIENDIKNISPNNLKKYTWILLSVKNLKKLCMSLRSKVGNQIRDYYILLEEILFDYKLYIKEKEMINSIVTKQNNSIISIVNEKQLNIFEFMNENNLELSNDDLFKELWFYLKDKKEILITPNLLIFMGFIKNETQWEKSTTLFLDRKKKFVMFSNENEIEYVEIDCKNKKCEFYE